MSKEEKQKLIKELAKLWLEEMNETLTFIKVVRSEGK